MPTRTLICFLTLVALAASPAVAGAADTIVVPGVEAPRLTALDGTVVWVSGKFPRQRLMQRNPDGTIAPVKGALEASYFAIDLGHDARGALVLTYARCQGTRHCSVYSDDLLGRRSAFKHLAPSNCQLTTAPSRWGARVAYGLNCFKLVKRRRVADPARSGLFVRTGRGPRTRLNLPADAIGSGTTRLTWVDLRGTNVGAAVSDVYSYAFTQTIHGTQLRSDLVGTSEGDSDAHVVGQALGTGGVLWTLVDALHGGDPNIAVISRLVGDGCSEYQTFINPPGPAQAERYLAEAMAVDDSTVYLYVPGLGIVAHVFTPAGPCV